MKRTLGQWIQKCGYLFNFSLIVSVFSVTFSSITYGAPTQEEPIRVPMIVAGRGLIGTSFTWFLQKILEKSQIKDQSILMIGPQSGHRATALSAATFYPPGNVLKTPSQDPSYFSHFLTVRSGQFYHWLHQGGDIGLKITGSYEFATTDKELSYLKEQNKLFHKLYPENKLIVKPEDIQRLDPRFHVSKIKGVFVMPGSGFVDGALTNSRLEEEAEKAGATVLDDEITHVRVVSEVSRRKLNLYSMILGNDSFNFDPPQFSSRPEYQIETRSGRKYITPNFVLAAGENVGSLAKAIEIPNWDEGGYDQIEIDSQSVKAHVTELQIVKTEKYGIPEKKDLPILMPSCLHASGKLLTHDPKSKERESIHYYTRLQTSEEGCDTILFGADRKVSETNDYEVDEKGKQEALQHFGKYFRGIDIVHSEKSYVCRMPRICSSDGRPVVGAIDEEKFPGLWIAAGFFSKGFQIGPAAMMEFSKMVAQKSFGVPIHWNTQVMEMLDPNRNGSGVKRIFGNKIK